MRLPTWLGKLLFKFGLAKRVMVYNYIPYEEYELKLN